MRKTKKEKRGLPEEKKIVPVAEDAIQTVLADAVDYTVFKKTCTSKSTEYGEAMSRVLKEQTKEKEEIKEEIEHKKEVVLAPWSIKLAESTKESLEVLVFGVVKGSTDIVQSSFIEKRISSYCVSTKNTIYHLEGPADCSVEVYPGFSAEVLEKFSSGFPMRWGSIIRTEARRIKEAGNKEKENNEGEENKREKRVRKCRVKKEE